MPPLRRRESSVSGDLIVERAERRRSDPTQYLLLAALAMRHYVTVLHHRPRRTYTTDLRTYILGYR